MALPEHKLSESPNTRAIDVAGWIITASTAPISSMRECDWLSATLDIPLPEMTFGSNALTLKHRASGAKLAFSTLEALRCVVNGPLGDGDGGVKVGYADKWLQSRTDPNSQLPLPTTVAAKVYDWTYTTTYSGHHHFDEPAENEDEMPPASESTPITWKPADPEDSADAIPMAELTRSDPILFYAEIPLYEDELHDNGSSTLIARIRVMPTCWFILLRYTLRVDNVLFRTYDTRIFHSFASSPPTIIREISGWEAPYASVQRRLPRYDDMTPLTDPAFIAKILSELPKTTTQKNGAQTGWRGMGNKKEVAKLDLLPAAQSITSSES
ncbi:hypothetical protein HYPSUDRAFT_31711 [Hypholoma sublateritium FD-334 SS-4]|uniref:Type 2A phosphatase activator TIP41 n=1 Tax=Hypholoma sublateritium (strain FD-334 SS-4) TaxID=945553 RepID=A0A0D2LNV3_HYPSF|nr:hypothetical protein HYPSUDRAFT_31711 [Hypholoma sublateritium FD-334 SS-4]